jgi:hypothetical protein
VPDLVVSKMGKNLSKEHPAPASCYKRQSVPPSISYMSNRIRIVTSQDSKIYSTKNTNNNCSYPEEPIAIKTV